MKTLTRLTFALTLFAASTNAPAQAADKWHSFEKPLIATKDDITLSGHGHLNVDRKRPQIIVPAGFELWVLAPPGATLSNALGKAIEDGKPIHKIGIRSKKTKQIIPVVPRVYKAGEKVPNYTLSPPTNLQLGKGGPLVIKVTRKMGSLNYLFQERLRKNHAKKGKTVRVFWLACTALKGAENQCVRHK